MFYLLYKNLPLQDGSVYIPSAIRYFIHTKLTRKIISAPLYKRLPHNVYRTRFERLDAE